MKYKQRKLKTINQGKPSLSDIPKPDFELFCKSLLETILDLHEEKEENKKEA